MRVKVRMLGTRYLNADGTLAAPLESPEELAELSAQAEVRHDDQQVSAALEHYHQDRELEPLLALLQEGNPGILRNREALELLAAAVRGQTSKGRGRVRAMAAKERDRRILAAAYWLHSMGMPLKNAPDKNKHGDQQKASACRLIAARVNLSEDAVYSIVRQSGRKRREIYMPSPFELLPWRLSGEPPTPEWVLRHYLPTEAESHARYNIGALWCELQPSILRAARRALEKRGAPTADEG